MSAMKELQITIEEVARVALEDPEMRSRIGHELDLADEELIKVWEWLEKQLNDEYLGDQDLYGSEWTGGKEGSK